MHGAPEAKAATDSTAAEAAAIIFFIYLIPPIRFSHLDIKTVNTILTNMLKNINLLFAEKVQKMNLLEMKIFLYFFAAVWYNIPVSGH
jgi:hypothetical protein